jgi:O-antigen ligase
LIKARFKESKSILTLLLLLFAMIPFQRRFHGAVDSFSRKLTLPDFPLPEYFSRKVHLYLADFFILAVCALLLMRFKTTIRDFFWNGPTKYLTLLFFVALISLMVSPTSHYVLQYLRLFQFSLVFVFFNAIACARKHIDISSFIHKLAWAMLGVACVQCFIGIAQYFCQSSLGLHFLGEANIGHFPFVNPGKQRWLFDQFFPSHSESPYLLRAAGTFTHPNILGGFLFCSLMASCYLCMKEESKSKRMSLAIIMLVQMFTLSITYSRSAILALICALIVWSFFQFKKTRQANEKRPALFRRYMLVAAILSVSALLGMGIFYSQITARGGIVNYNDVTHYSDSERVQYLRMACTMIKEHPFFGVGFNNFQLCSEPTQADFPGHVFFAKVHNIYLLIAAETGLIGGGLFLLFLLTLLTTAWKSLAYSDEQFQEKIFLFSVFLGLLLIGACDFYFFNTQHGRMLFFGLSACLYAVTAHQHATSKDNISYEAAETQ